MKLVIEADRGSEADGEGEAEEGSRAAGMDNDDDDDVMDSRRRKRRWSQHNTTARRREITRMDVGDGIGEGGGRRRRGRRRRGREVGGREERGREVGERLQVTTGDGRWVNGRLLGG